MPRDLASVRLARLSDLVRLLGSRPVVSRQRLMEDLGLCNKRTLERDLLYLRDQFGAKIVWDRRHKGYKLFDPGSLTLFLSFSKQEAIALVAGLDMACHFLPHLQNACGALWGKLRTALPATLAHEASRLARGVVVSLPVSSLDPRIFQILLEAVERRQIVRGHYVSPYGAQPVAKDVVLSPWGVFFRAHAWYLWAWSHSSEGERTYRISRFSTLLVTEKPAMEPPEDREVSGVAESAWYGFSGKTSEGVDIAIRVLPPLSRVVAETRWHVSQSIDVCPDGSVLLRARVPVLEEVARWVLASAPSAEVVEPLTLRDLVAQLARGVLARCGKTTTK